MILYKKLYYIKVLLCKNKISRRTTAESQTNRKIDLICNYKYTLVTMIDKLYSSTLQNATVSHI